MPTSSHRTEIHRSASSRASTLPATWPRRASVIAAIVFLAGCSATPAPPVPMVAASDTLAVLAGEWWGEYSSSASGRNGRIHFRVEADSHTAHGDVLMFSRSSGVPEPANYGIDHPMTETLAIRFVRLGNDARAIAGSLEPYRDPGCRCILSTTFVGRLDGDRITGTYISHGGSMHPTTTGRWRVDRRAMAEDETEP